MKFLIVSDREYRKTSRGIDIITTYLAEKGHSVDHLVFFRRIKIPEKQAGKNIRQLHFHDFLGIYRDKMRLFLPGFLLSAYFTYIIKKQTSVNFDSYDFIILESGYPVYLAPVISGKIIYRQSDPVEIAFNTWRPFYRKLERAVIQKAVFISSALQSIFYPPEYAKKIIFWHSGFSPIYTDKIHKPEKAFVFMGGGEIDIKLIKKIAAKHPDYIFHIIGTFNKNYTNKNVIFHGYLEYYEYQKIVLSSSICIIHFSKRFVHRLKRCYFTAKILLPMSLGMPILLKSYGTITQSDESKKLFVYKNSREALSLLDKIIKKLEGGEIEKIEPETLEFLRPQTTENRIKELDAIFTHWLQSRITNISPKKILINGDFLCRRLTGIERYAYEITRRLDNLISFHEAAIVIPSFAENVPVYKNLEIIRLEKKRKSNILWQMVTLQWFLITHKQYTILEFGNTCLPFAPGIVFLHDIYCEFFPEDFVSRRDKWTRLYSRIQYRMIARLAKKIVTVSEFSKNQIVKSFHVKPEKITVIYSSADHIREITADDSIFEQFDILKQKPFYFSLGSLSKRKNIRWIIEYAGKHPEALFALSGTSLSTVKVDELEGGLPKNIILLGYLDDAKVKALMQKCKAFILPSYYEGFGLTPLEALSCGARIIAAKAASLPEIYGNTAHYIDPFDTDVDLDELLEQPVDKPDAILAKYSYNAAAEQVYRIIQEFISCVSPNMKRTR